MPSNTERLLLLKKNPATDGNDTFNIETMLNENWEKIDENVAMVDENGKVINKDGTAAGGVTSEEFATHKADDTTAHGINLKANKAQENWITATLQSGWTPAGNGVRYAKNDMNLIVLQFEAVAGTVSAEIVIAQLPVGYLPKNTIFRIINRSTGAVVGDIKIDENGYIRVPTGTTLTTGTIYNGTVVFYQIA